jgi:predicted glycogen debranching enzyme
MKRLIPAESLSTDAALSKEWIVTNGIGGYASGTILGPPTRRHHGPLTAALAAPIGRAVIVDDLTETVESEDSGLEILGCVDRMGGIEAGIQPAEFALEDGLPVWRYRVGDTVLEKSILMPHLQNTTHITYRIAEGRGPVRLRLRPWLAFHRHDAPIDAEAHDKFTLIHTEGQYEFAGPKGYPTLKVDLRGREPAFAPAELETVDFRYRIEEERGGTSPGARQSPGWLSAVVTPDSPATLILSVEPWTTVRALSPADAAASECERRARLIAAADEPLREGIAAELVLAADQFLITPAGRAADAVRAHAVGDEVRSVIAGYHWFTDWGRDTMISLEGLTLATGRHREAGDILLTFAHHVRDGLIPNLFPEGREEGLYHTADATLWFFHAIDRYRLASQDDHILKLLLPTLVEIVDRHRAGTRFGIRVDPSDGLLTQGVEGYQLTWMDAKVDGWVVTPRRGKAVEINALWYNALRLLEGWLREAGREADAEGLDGLASRAYRSFNERFWNERMGFLFDVVDGPEGDDPACRPNQVLSISLRHPALIPSRWPAVLETVRGRLLTPVGLRSLAPGHPDYKARYFGDLRSRDAAYHQGTVWTWLIGPFIDAWLRHRPDDKELPRRILDDLAPHLEEAGIGTVSEIFDAEPPFTPRGCVAQAWSVAEMLRSLAHLARD